MPNDYIDPYDLSDQASQETEEDFGDGYQEDYVPTDQVQIYETADGRLVDATGQEYEQAYQPKTETQELLDYGTDLQLERLKQREPEPQEEIPQEPEKPLGQQLIDDFKEGDRDDDI